MQALQLCVSLYINVAFDFSFPWEGRSAKLVFPMCWSMSEGVGDEFDDLVDTEYLYVQALEFRRYLV
jgi:hypothetical protein